MNETCPIVSWSMMDWTNLQVYVYSAQRHHSLLCHLKLHLKIYLSVSPPSTLNFYLKICLSQGPFSLVEFTSHVTLSNGFAHIHFISPSCRSLGVWGGVGIIVTILTFYFILSSMYGWGKGTKQTAH